jgi:hypothetical protein
VNKYDALRDTHEAFLEALRRREQEIIQFLAILVPALGAFGWLLKYAECKNPLFIGGTIAIQLLLFFGACYSLALGYNSSYFTLQISKFQAALGIDKYMLEKWPRSSKSFKERFDKCSFPGSYLPEIIKVFYWAFLTMIVVVTLTACFTGCGCATLSFIIPIGSMLFIIGVIISFIYQCKLRALAKEEPDNWPTFTE